MLEEYNWKDFYDKKTENFFGRQPGFRTLTGTAGELLVCYNLLQQGIPAFLTSAGFPYDVVADINGKLYKIQVKSTECARPWNNGKINSAKRAVYQFSNHIDRTVDIAAFVALDTNDVAYLNIADCPTIIHFDNDTSYIEGEAPKYSKGGCRKFKDFPFMSALPKEERPFYLCTPYSKFKGGFEEAYQMAAEMLMLLERNKLFVFCPIVHSHTAVKYAPDLHTHEFWLDVDFKFIRISRGLIVCTMEGWKESYGIAEEIKYAERLGLPVYYTSFMELPELK